ncbi:hypothetical protein PHLCEN_2v11691 [Hermanssonia centrifuga]|uniref:Uncharacterized protein n=1 Tax=Hermanssonia centrifuga TaxID=98765 RepID=A0A2R6NJ91_9APHY|nr:hypothetical protein PHLCEN_2v11691 [Hermanssonia centrifuga]
MGEDLDHGRDAQNHYIDDAIAGQIWTEAGGPFILSENNDFYHSQGVSVEDKESHMLIYRDVIMTGLSPHLGCTTDLLFEGLRRID